MKAMAKTPGPWPRYNFRWSLGLAKKGEEEGKREMHISLSAALISNGALHERRSRRMEGERIKEQITRAGNPCQCNSQTLFQAGTQRDKVFSTGSCTKQRLTVGCI